MNFEIDLNGRTRTIAVERTPEGTFRVLIEGRIREVDAVRVGVHGLSLILGDDGVSRELQVTPTGARNEYFVTFAGRVAAASVNARQTGHGGGDTASGTHGEQPITAPMPGRVVRLLVQPGDAVAVRQGVAVVEAMKMENELRSPKAGIVKEVNVTPGMSVDAGRVLLVVE